MIIPLRLCALAVALCLLALVPALAQDENPACPAVVDEALFQLGDNCAGLGRNTACYGYNRVSATFAQPVSESFFTRPSEKTNLADVQTISTSPLDLALNEWGIAVLNVQANVPDTLPGQAVTFLLLGDTEVENAVAPDQQAAGPATAILQAPVDLRGDASADSPVIAALPAGTVLQIEAASADRNWLRVTTGAGAGWISSEAVNRTSAIDRLPVEGQQTFSPMQSFYLRTGLGGTECSETPSVLAVKSPENITVDLMANGARIRLGSLITLQILPNNVLRLTTLEGQAILEPDTPQQTIVPAGFSTARCLSEADSLGSDGQENDQNVGEDCDWEEPRPANPDELLQGEIVQAALIQLGSPPVLPVATQQAIECPFGTTITHVVTSGENLFRIGLRYQTSMGAIMQANGLTNPERIFVGQRLTIPCGVDTGLPTVPLIPTELPPDQPPPGVVDCSSFRATSPLDGLPYGTATFYWDAARGATSYQVNIYNLDEKGGALVGTFIIGGGSTNLSADVTIDSIGYGFSFAWEVLALLDGQVACASQRYTVPRAAQPAVQPFTAAWYCGSTGTYTVFVNWSNLPPGDSSVNVSFSNAFTSGPTGGGPFSGGSGTQSFSTVTTVSGGLVTALPSETTVALPGTLNCL